MFRRVFDWLFNRGLDLHELARRLDVRQEQLLAVDRSYHEFQIRKRSGMPRQIAAPNPELKKIQRRVLRRLLARLKVHPQATGFQPGISFVDNARCHQSQAVVIKVDLVDFFPSIQRLTIEKYFRNIGWNRKTARLLSDLTTHRDVLPQGAPTSPRLSNLVNYLLDARLAGLAAKYQGIYTRYADDITISLGPGDHDIHRLVKNILGIVRDHQYQPHVGRKFDVRRSHQRQVVTGLVVNDRANLPREKRRWLRAVEHRMNARNSGGAPGPSPTLTAEQLQGWQSLRNMINPA